MKMMMSAALLLALSIPVRAEGKPPVSGPGNPEARAERQEFREELKADRQAFRQKQHEERKADRQAFKEKQREKRMAHREKMKDMRRKAREERREKKAEPGAASAPAPAAE
ncbi:MAG: hypothetical protein HY403_06265 [Elusimicrobia bacterium]|nr:hypothetical protein [Elusimicrobiota bacterium]